MSGSWRMADDAHRAALLSLLHWDHLPGLHTTGMAHLQMWTLASREGLLRRASATPSSRKVATPNSAKETRARARKPAAGAQGQTKPDKATTTKRPRSTTSPRSRKA